MLTSDLFENKTPAAWRAGYERGLRYYRQGPDNPYPAGSEEAKDYADGYHNGELDSYDKYDTSTMNEGAVKELSQDLRSMSDEEFLTRYKMTKAQVRAGMKSGVAEGLDEAVGGNYLYHATSASGLKAILSSGGIRSARAPQSATSAQTKLPTVSVTRDWGYASGVNAQTQMVSIGRDAILVLDRNAVESNFKTLGTSQSTNIKGLAFNPYLTKDGAARSQNTDPMARANAKGKAKYAEPTAKSGGEFEEAVVVPKGALPLKGTMVGFWINPKSELVQDPAIMNDPRRLDMPRPNQFVKAAQPQGVAEDNLKEFAPGNGDGDEAGDDPYKYPKPKRYNRSADYFEQFEADHFDREDFDDDTGVFKGYWGNTQIAYFKFDNPARTGGNNPGMGWYYEPQTNNRSDDTNAAPAADDSAQRKQQELSMINAFLKSGNRPNPDSQIGRLMKKHGLAEGQVNELSSDLLKQAAQVAKNKSDRAMDPKIHDALGGGYMNPLAKHYDTMSDKFSNRAVKIGQRDAVKTIASPATMRKIGMAEEQLTEQDLAEAVSTLELADFLFKGLEQKFPKIIERYGHEVVGNAIMDVAEENLDVSSVSEVDMLIDDIIEKLQNYNDNDSGLRESTVSRLYYNVVGTSAPELRKDFGMRHDRRGWFLSESSGRNRIMDAQRAFGSPKLVEYSVSDATGGAAQLGPDNVVSPVGSVPKSQRTNTKKRKS